MHKQKSSLEVLINCVIGVLLVFLAVAAFDTFVRQKEGNDPTRIANQVLRGRDLSQLGIDWTLTDETLVLAISPGCEYCSQSAPFYQQISRQIAQGRAIRLVVVLPKSETSSAKYLEDMGLFVDEIRELPLNAIGVALTPTILLADRQGVIKDAWVGKLSAARETEVLARLDIREGAVTVLRTDQSAHRAVAGVITTTRPEVMEEIGMGHRIVVLDVRDRADYAKDHLTVTKNTKNIPLDELPTRANNELNHSDKIVISCSCLQNDLSRIAGQLLLEKGFYNVALLDEGPPGVLRSVNGTDLRVGFRTSR